VLFDNRQNGFQDHPLRRLHALSRLVIVVVLCFLSYFTKGWLPLVSILLLVVLLRALPGWGMRDGLKEILSFVRTLLPFIILIVLINVILVAREKPVSYRLLIGLRQSIRVLNVLLALRLLLWTTSPMELSDTFIRLLYPLKRIGLRVEDLSLVLMLIFSFVPLITREAERIRTAQAVRSGFKRGFGVVREVVPLLVPLVIGVFRRAEEVESSLRVRYFERRGSMSGRKRLELAPIDFAVLIISAAVFVAGLYSKVLSGGG